MEPKALSVVMEKLEDIPETYRDLFTEQDGKYVLTGILGVKTQVDVDQVNTKLSAEREAHKKTRDRMQPFVALNDEQLKGATDWLAKREEVEARLEAAGKQDEAAIKKIVDSQVAAQMVPINRAKADAETKLAEAGKTIETLQTERTVRIIHDSAREALVRAKILPDAEPDVLMLAERALEVDEEGSVRTKDKQGVTAGISAYEWVMEMQPKRKHWWPPSEGGGSQGSRTQEGLQNNPYLKAHWNVTEQGKIEAADPKLGERMRKAAGDLPLGVTKPVK